MNNSFLLGKGAIAAIGLGIGGADLGWWSKASGAMPIHSESPGRSKQIPDRKIQQLKDRFAQTESPGRSPSFRTLVSIQRHPHQHPSLPSLSESPVFLFLFFGSRRAG